MAARVAARAVARVAAARAAATAAAARAEATEVAVKAAARAEAVMVEGSVAAETVAAARAVGERGVAKAGRKSVVHSLCNPCPMHKERHTAGIYLRPYPHRRHRYLPPSMGRRIFH